MTAEFEMLPKAISQALTEKGAGSFDTLFSYRLAAAAATGSALSIDFVANVFHASRIEFGTSPSPRDKFDIEHIYEALKPHFEKVRRMRGNAAFSEIFRLIYER